MPSVDVYENFLKRSQAVAGGRRRSQAVAGGGHPPYFMHHPSILFLSTSLISLF